jgi:hypothetical protein
MVSCAIAENKTAPRKNWTKTKALKNLIPIENPFLLVSRQTIETSPARQQPSI